MQIGALGIALIRNSEGFSAFVYRDVAGYPTIGIGHKLRAGESFPNGITEAQGDELLDKDLTPVEGYLNTVIPAECTQNQFDALCDFGFNLGPSALQVMLTHGWTEVPAQLPLWCHAKVKGVEVEVPALVTRRAAEVVLFNTPDVPGTPPNS
jgi:lysozyme